MGRSSSSSESSSPSRRTSTSSVSRVIRSLSDALGITTSQFNPQKIISYEDGKFVVDIDALQELLDVGGKYDKVNALKLLQDEIVNLTTEKKLEIWASVKSTINLKKEGSIRTEALNVFVCLLDCPDIPKSKALSFYTDICENINFTGIDRDMKLFLVAFYKLLTLFADIDDFEKYTANPLNEFLVKLYNQILVYHSEELEVLIVSLITQCLSFDKDLFTSDELYDMFKSILKLNIETKNMIMITSFLDFFLVYLTTGYKYDEDIYTILSIIGCANGLEELESSGKCEVVMDTLLCSASSKQIPFLLCDVIVGRYNNEYPHRTGNRSIIGCIRYLCYILSYLGKPSKGGISVTEFFDHHLNYLFRSMFAITESSDRVVRLEVLKFIDETLESPYTINGYYKYFIERSEFWDLLISLNWSYELPISSSYQAILNELFNKLQNFEINNYYVKKLVAYFESNYEILSSYNISFALNYYSKNLICVCGALNWKQNCENIVQKYYYTAPKDVLNVLKDAFLYCLPFKINKESLDFYVNLICYVCVIGLDYKLDDDILDPISDTILKLDNEIFSKVISDYQLEMKNEKEKNSTILCKILIYSTLKFSNVLNISYKMNLLLNTIAQIAEYTQQFPDSTIFIIVMLLLTKLRAFVENGKKYHYIVEFSSVEARTNLILSRNSAIKDNNDRKEVDFKVNQTFINKFTDIHFEKEVSKFFQNGKTSKFETDFDPNILLKHYTNILGNTLEWEYYLIILKNLRNQLLNYELFDGKCRESTITLINLFTKQMQFIYEFKFETPHWLHMNYIRIAIVDVLYGIYPYKKLIPIGHGEDLLRSIALNFHFSDITRCSYLNFLNCCLFEFPAIMKHFILPILKMIRDDISKPETLFSNLEFALNLVELTTSSTPSYRLTEKESKLMSETLDITADYELEKYRDTYYDEIKCSKYLANLVTLKMKNETTFDIKEKKKLKFIHVLPSQENKGKLDNIFEKLTKCFQDNELERSLIDTNKITSEEVGAGFELYQLTNDGAIDILLCDRELMPDILSTCVDKLIIITFIEESRDYFCISNYGFQHINMRNVITSETNLIKFVRILIELCSISTMS